MSESKGNAEEKLETGEVGDKIEECGAMEAEEGEKNIEEGDAYENSNEERMEEDVKPRSNSRYNNRNRGRNRTGGRHSGRHTRRHVPYRSSNQDDESDRSRRVYVGNLSWEVNWRELKDYMKATGCEVTRADVMTTPDGRSKGCGLVEFATADGAQRAVSTLNDTDFFGRQIFVREDREEGYGARGSTQQEKKYVASEGTQNRRVYVGNLSWDVAWQDLKDHMRQVGDVLFAEVMTESDGRSKGCGIVEFAQPSEAQQAIIDMTDTELKGRMIFVREDRETGQNRENSSTNNHQRHQNITSVFVGNLAFECSWQDLKDHMRQAGNVDQANILTNDDGRSKGCGIVTYVKAQDAQNAIQELQNTILHERAIFVREDREQSNHLQLFVGNLSYDTSWRELKDHFRQCGEVERADVIHGPDGRKRGYGTVRFYSSRDAQNAITRLNGVELMSRSLEVRVDHKAD